MKMCVGRMECQPESRQGLENRSRTTTSYLFKFSCHGQRHFKAKIRVGNKKFVANYSETCIEPVKPVMINWFTLINKKLMQTYIVSLWSIVNVSTVHLNGIWHLIWRYLSKTVLGGHPVLSGHYEGVRLIQVSLYNKHDLTLQTIHTRKSGWKGSWIRWTVNNIIY